MPTPYNNSTSSAKSNGNDANFVRPQVVNNGIKLVGEVLLPGASELLEGRIGKGAAAAGVGLGVPALSAVLLGPVAALVVGGGAALGARVLSFWDSLQPDGGADFSVGGGKHQKGIDELDHLLATKSLTVAEYKEMRAAMEGSS